ncbi:coiled-coil domain-containing protein 110-like [Gavia stellata]|uniref:coiled-coil domain-containing protein 110-like n=1 Tax=Gavia stellata TaxID=37040 RepID=UPI0028A05363|nr:coiled-coil domain-containing protein 110-like [Gavia stellata]
MPSGPPRRRGSRHHGGGGAGKPPRGTHFPALLRRSAGRRGELTPGCQRSRRRRPGGGEQGAGQRQRAEAEAAGLKTLGARGAARAGPLRAGGVTADCDVNRHAAPLRQCGEGTGALCPLRLVSEAWDVGAEAASRSGSGLAGRKSGGEERPRWDGGLSRLLRGPAPTAGRRGRDRGRSRYLFCHGCFAFSKEKLALGGSLGCFPRDLPETRSPVDDRTAGAEDPTDLQTTLKILQQELESFQTFGQQTLENIYMVQSKIREILNKYTFERKTPLCSSDKILMTCTPSDASLLMEYPESLSSKREVHHDQQPCSDEHVEVNSNTGNVISDINTPHRISLKTTAIEKVEKSEDLFGNNRILAIENECKCGHLLSGTDLETERLNAAHKKVILSESKHHISSPKFGKEFHKTDNINYLTKFLKPEFQQSVHNDLDLLADNTEKSGFSYREKFNNFKKSAEMVTSLDESHIGLDPVQENGLHFDQEFHKDSKCANVWGGSPTTVYSEKAESQSKNVRKEFRINYSEGDRFQINSFSEMVKDKLLMLDNKQKLEKEKEQQQTTLNQTLPRPGNQKFCEIKVASEYDGKMEALQKSLKNSKDLQKTAHDLPNKNLALKNKVEPLTLTIQSSKEKISKYNVQIIYLAEEKKCVQPQLVKSQEDNKECVKEAKNFLIKWKEPQNQKNILEEERNQLPNRNQHSIQTQHDFQISNQKVEEKMTAVTCERQRLSAILKFLQKEHFKLQETNEKLEMEISQLTKENSSLKQELERNQSSMQQIKEKETAAKSELETHLQLMKTLEAKSLNLEMALQECSDTKQMLQKDFEKLQSDKAYTEKKLMTELRNAKADIDLLKSNLTSANRECKRLSTALTNVTEENPLLKKELQEYRQDTSKYENDIRKLTKERLLLENLPRTTENERDVSQSEFRRLLKDCIHLRRQVTAVVCGQGKPGYTSGTTQYYCYSEYSTRICREISV